MAIKVFVVPRFMEHLLKETVSFSVSSFNTVKELLNAMAEDIPDVVITKMGEKGEEELIEAVRMVRTGYIPVISYIGKTRDIDWKSYPVDDFIEEGSDPACISLRIKLSVERAKRASDLNPLTRLPGNTSILRYINERLKSREETCICYIDIDNFKPFNDRYGFSRGDELILMLSRILKSSMEGIPNTRSFLGHLGGDDFVAAVPKDKADTFCKSVISNFSRLSKLLVDEEDLKKGSFISKERDGSTKEFPLPSVSIAVVSVGGKKGKFKHPGEVAQAAAQIKSFLKSRGGNGYLVDRREASSGITSTSDSS